jgi:uncharacterized repeat protein (TIGR02543 family)
MVGRTRLQRAVALLGVLFILLAGVVVAVPSASAAIITQTSPQTGTTDVASSATYQTTVAFSGNTATPVTFSETTTNPDIAIDPSTGVISTTGTLPVSGSPYQISGNIADGGADSGSWSFSLSVSGDPITQTSLQTDTTDVAGSAAYRTTVAVSGNNAPVTFNEVTTNPDIAIDPSTGVISTTGTLPVSGSPYSISGTDSDSDGDLGNWSFSLSVSGDPITQTSLQTGTTDVASSAAYQTTVAVSGNNSPVTFSEVTTNPDIAIDPSTGVISTTGTLPVSGSPYSISGTDSDSDGDSGSWSFSLAVTGGTITQTSATSSSVSASASASYSTTVAVSGNLAPVTFHVTSTPSTPGLAIEPSTGVISTTGTLPVSGSPYVISGTVTDSDGDSGTWTFTLTVDANPVISIEQTSPTTGATTSDVSKTFVPGSIAVENNIGAVTFVTTVASTALSVSSAGVITTTGYLNGGTYTVSGTDSDTHSDVGTWTYTLIVTTVVTTVTFNANDGSGTMAPENAGIPTALALNAFTRSGYSFVDWNTAVDGSGTSYANGSTYPFNASVTLYAQWKVGKAVVYTVQFNANAGSGAMAPEHESTPTGLSANLFTRTGYTFAGWNTKANGSGARYANGATYPFKSSAVLFAQWKKIPKPPKAPTFTVTFIANGGKGTMGVERHGTPEALSANAFTRTGYTFAGWNTTANGKGTVFANGAVYSFSGSVTLYAQWKKIKKVVPPPPPKRTGPVVGPFLLKGSQLTSALKGEVVSIANEVKAKGDTTITLLGYGDELSAKNDHKSALVTANVELGRMRAQAVATYLEGRLAALGLSGWTISIAGASSSVSTAFNAGIVIATLS